MIAALIVAFTNTKGGVTKSTLAAHLVLWLFDKGFRVSLLDADGKQNSSGTWIRNAEPTIPVAIVTDATEIEVKLQELAQRSDIVVADTPGHGNDAAYTVTLLSDIAVVPLQPSKLAVRALGDALQFILLGQESSGGEKPKPYIVLTHTHSGSVRARRLRDTIRESLDVPVLNAQMRFLDAFADSPDSSVNRMRGREARQAAADIDAIFSELLADHLSHIDGSVTSRAANE